MFIMSLITAKISGITFRLGNDSDDEEEYNEVYYKEYIKNIQKKRIKKSNYFTQNYFAIVVKFIKIIDKFV